MRGAGKEIVVEMNYFPSKRRQRKRMLELEKATHNKADNSLSTAEVLEALE